MNGIVITMSKQLYICEHGEKCRHKEYCIHAKIHYETPSCTDICHYSDMENYKFKCKPQTNEWDSDSNE